MRILSHGIKSLLRRPAKTVMLFLILLVVFNLIFIGFIIENSISESKEYIRNQIGSAVEYKMDYEALMSGMEQGPRMEMEAISGLSLQVADKMSESPYVSQYFITETANVNSEDVSPAETQETSGGFQMNFSDFNLKGSNVAEHIDFVMNNITLTEGNLLSEEQISNGDYVILISEDIASANNLRVGDMVGLSLATRSNNFGPDRENGGPGGANSSLTQSEIIDFEIVGMYEANNDDFDVNTILTSNVVIEDMNGVTPTDETNASIVYMLDDPDHVTAFIEENTPYLTSEYHTLYSNDDEYKSLTKPLTLISVITSILYMVVFGAGVIIILAIVTIFVRDRKFEIGLLMASGAGRMNIISQFFFEILTIAVVSFIVATGTSNVASGYVGDWIVENQLLSDDSIISSDDGGNDFNLNRIVGASSTAIYGDVNMQNVANEFDASVSIQVIGKLMAASMLLVLVGSTVPLVIIMGYNPRRILQDN